MPHAPFPSILRDGGRTIGGPVASAAPIGVSVVMGTMVVRDLVVTLILKPSDHRRPEHENGPGLVKGLVPQGGLGFWLVFIRRFRFALGTVLLTTFQLSAPTDYLHLPADRAAHVIPVATALLGPLAALAVILTAPLSDRSGRTKVLAIAASVIVGIRRARRTSHLPAISKGTP